MRKFTLRVLTTVLVTLLGTFGLSSLTAQAATVAPSCIACIGGVSITYTKLSGPVFIAKKHVKYLTPTWQKASAYTWSTTTTATATVSTSLSADAKAVTGSLGLTYAVSRGYSVGVTIPANSSYYSKLALKADYNRYYVKKTLKYSGSTSYYYGYVYSPTPNQYLVVVYQ